ncbi:MAG TPA: MBL fold metallo-hydrolase [Bacilli bacterium]
MDSLIFLGTGDSMGVPRVYCSCAVCTEARGTGKNARLRSSVLIQAGEEDLLIDCGPDWTRQMEQLQKREIGHVLVTHAHHDHVAGLPEWGDACRWTLKKGNVYAPADVLNDLHRRYPWLESNLTYHDISTGFEFEGWQIQPWKVNHGKNGHSYAYHWAKDGFKWVYCSDAISLPDDQKNLLFELDLLILGTSFYHEEAELATRSVYDMVEALELVAEVKPGRVIFTHMSHAIDMERDYGLPSNVKLARLGMQCSLLHGSPG